jgi:hypothetical protein
MGIQTATTGNLENAQNIVIATCNFTAEHNDPCHQLVTNYKLGKGEKQMTVPKVGQMDAQELTDGVDLVDSESIGMTTTDLTASEVGLKVILTDKLLRQENEDMFKVVGRQMGDAMSRKKDEDIIALFSALNGGTTLGVDNCGMSLDNVTGCTAFAKANKFPRPIYIVHHPNAVARCAKDTMAVGATYFAGIMPGVSEQVYKNFWKMNVDGVDIFQDGNIDKESGADSGYGAVFSKAAMCVIESLAPTTERERDASLRAWEVVVVSDYGCFELDDGYGAPMLYEIGAASTTGTS